MRDDIAGIILGTKQDQKSPDSHWEMVFEARPTTEAVDSYNEITDGKAFMKAMKAYMEKNPVVMFNHQSDNTIGRVLDYRKDKDGPIVKIGIARTDLGRDVAELIRAEVVTKMSFMFGDPVYEDEEDMEGVRRLTSFKLYEIGPVSIPANMEAVITEAKAKGIDLKTLTKDGGNPRKDNTMPEIKSESTKRLDQLDEMFGDVKDQVTELTENAKTYEEAADEQQKILKAVSEKVDQLHDGRITEAEFTEMSEKVGERLEALQKEIKRVKRARALSADREKI